MLRFSFNYWYILGTLNQHKFHCMSTAHTYDNILLIFICWISTLNVWVNGNWLIWKCVECLWSKFIKHSSENSLKFCRFTEVFICLTSIIMSTSSQSIILPSTWSMILQSNLVKPPLYKPPTSFTAKNFVCNDFPFHSIFHSVRHFPKLLARATGTHYTWKSVISPHLTPLFLSHLTLNVPY